MVLKDPAFDEALLPLKGDRLARARKHGSELIKNIDDKR
jgi:hypothetical protein